MKTHGFNHYDADHVMNIIVESRRSYSMKKLLMMFPLHFFITTIGKTFIQNFLGILKISLQNYKNIMNKMFH